jgi:hypothetical protein
MNRVFYHCVVLLAIGSGLSRAQSLPSNNNSGKNGAALIMQAGAAEAALADIVWARIKGFGTFDSPINGNGSDERGMPAVDQLITLIDQANKLQAFHRQFPSHSAAREAQRLESLCLGMAALRGDYSHEVRRRILVEQLRKDKTLPPDKIAEAVALNLQVDIAQQRFASYAAHLAARESAARALIDEFPEVPAGYETLLAVGNDSGPLRGRAIAEELIRSRSPAGVKGEARAVLDQYELVGRSVGALLAQAGASDLPAGAKGKSMILYGWSSGDTASLRAAKQLGWTARETFVVGINLDQDANIARQVAMREKLPADQYYDTSGRLAGALKMARPGKAYLIDQNGIIQDVFEMERMNEILSQLGK